MFKFQIGQFICIMTLISNLWLCVKNNFLDVAQLPFVFLSVVLIEFNGKSGKFLSVLNFGVPSGMQKVIGNPFHSFGYLNIKMRNGRGLSLVKLPINNLLDHSFNLLEANDPFNTSLILGPSSLSVHLTLS
jgi:hypothetical protein